MWFRQVLIFLIILQEKESLMCVSSKLDNIRSFDAQDDKSEGVCPQFLIIAQIENPSMDRGQNRAGVCKTLQRWNRELLCFQDPCATAKFYEQLWCPSEKTLCMVYEHIPWWRKGANYTNSIYFMAISMRKSQKSRWFFDRTRGKLGERVNGDPQLIRFINQLVVIQNLVHWNCQRKPEKSMES